MLHSRILSISIDRKWRDVYEAIWRPQDFTKWASGLAEGELHQVGDAWQAQGPDGPVKISFSPHNAFGVMDHHVEVAPGIVVHIPLRIIANGDGADVQFTLFRQSTMSDEQFAADAATVERDLLVLKTLAES